MSLMSKKVILISDFKDGFLGGDTISWESDRSLSLKTTQYGLSRSPIGLVEHIPVIKKMITEVANFTDFQLHEINGVGLEGLQNHVTLNLTEELMYEVRNKSTYFRIELFQIINAVNCHEQVSLRAGLDINLILKKARERTIAYEKEQREKEPWGFLTGEFLSTIIKL